MRIWLQVPLSWNLQDPPGWRSGGRVTFPPVEEILGLRLYLTFQYLLISLPETNDCSGC